MEYYINRKVFDKEYPKLKMKLFDTLKTLYNSEVLIKVSSFNKKQYYIMFRNKNFHNRMVFLGKHIKNEKTDFINFILTNNEDICSK